MNIVTTRKESVWKSIEKETGNIVSVASALVDQTGSRKVVAKWINLLSIARELVSSGVPDVPSCIVLVERLLLPIQAE
jgi:hypothetical protein